MALFGLEQPFWPLKFHQRAQHGRVQSKIVHLCGYHPNYTYWTQYLEFQDFMLFHKGLIFSNNVILWVPRRAQKVQNQVCEVFIVYISRLDHHVVFLTQYGAIQDFQRSKNCWKEAQQTQPLSPLGPPWADSIPLKSLSTPKYTWYHPSICCVTC